jgi:hypothetical protein
LARQQTAPTSLPQGSMQIDFVRIELQLVGSPPAAPALPESAPTAGPSHLVLPPPCVPTAQQAQARHLLANALGPPLDLRHAPLLSSHILPLLDFWISCAPSPGTVSATRLPPSCIPCATGLPDKPRTHRSLRSTCSRLVLAAYAVVGRKRRWVGQGSELVGLNQFVDGWIGGCRIALPYTNIYTPRGNI